MQDVNIIYNNAGLALAAYADLLAGNTADQALALQSAGMSQAQAEEFAARFPNIVTQYTSTDTGLSATVFRDASGELHLALRGTEVSDLDDLATDIDISLQGAGYDQIVDMYNWWQRVSATPGEAVQQFRLILSGEAVAIEMPMTTKVVAHEEAMPAPRARQVGGKATTSFHWL